jgi:cytochrome c-type biogenesis protein CcsB
MKNIKFLFSPILMGILFVLFAVAMAVATFIENDYGSPVAYNMVYNTFWFELILLLLAINLAGRLIVLKLYRKDKIAVFLFHISFILMIAGAAITRYLGWEGTIHVREGEEQNTCYTGAKFIGYSVTDESGKVTESDSEEYSMTAVSADDYQKTINIGGKSYELLLAKIIPNAADVIEPIANGVPVISLYLTTDMQTGEALVLKKGDRKTAAGVTISFDAGGPADAVITFESDSFMISSVNALGVMSMVSHTSVITEPGNKLTLKQMQVVTLKDIKIVPQEMVTSGNFRAVAVNPEEQKTGQNAFIFHLTGGQNSETVYLWDNESGTVASGSCNIGGNRVEIKYGSETTILPFSIKLNDFILERYPGSTSPSGYKSDVVLIDKTASIERPFMIFMNNILKYKGYRFYQSSFDQDEKGTILSVNHDPAGMVVTYAGYLLLILFIIIALVSKNTIFRTIAPSHWQSNIRKQLPMMLVMMFLTVAISAQGTKLVPAKPVAEEFGKILIQDQKGRTKPLFTLSNDILRKVTRTNEFEGLSAMQVFSGLLLDFNNWKNVPMITVGNTDIRKKLGITGKYAAFTDLVEIDGSGTYKISQEVNDAYNKAPGDRNKVDKEVMKIDERVNIIYMIYNGDFLKIFPMKDGLNTWGSMQEALEKAASSDDSTYLGGIIPVLKDALQTNNLTVVKQVTKSIGDYQTRFAGYDLPSSSKTSAELLYYRLSIFERLFPFYATVGVVMLIVLITMVIMGKKENSLLLKILTGFLFAGFLFHTFGVALRWYIAGRAPMSNGYESMIFISWVTILAGFIFSRRSAFTLSATAVLASMTLLVAHLSFMDPEITNLVPVLKSYWLTLHVSVITGSYGFLGLGAVLSLIVMILLSLSDKKNLPRIANTIDELTVINFKTLTLGLYFLTIGTFLGAIWANESWGRYWGWDPKETWSLITIIIYSIVVHSRSIPGMKDIFTFNLISLFAFSSVLMTYFGVNYYLSGMHSYGSGDPVPVPAFVYIAVILLTALSVFAYLKYSYYNKINAPGVKN